MPSSLPLPSPASSRKAEATWWGPTGVPILELPPVASTVYMEPGSGVSSRAASPGLPTAAHSPQTLGVGSAFLAQGYQMVMSSPGPSLVTLPLWVGDAEAEPSLQNRSGRFDLLTPLPQRAAPPPGVA